VGRPQINKPVQTLCRSGPYIARLKRRERSSFGVDGEFFFSSSAREQSNMPGLVISP
jgi:hypothetical protein